MELKTKRVYSNSGPVYNDRDVEVGTVKGLSTSAVSKRKAVCNIVYRIRKAGGYEERLFIDDSLVVEEGAV